MNHSDFSHSNPDHQLASQTSSKPLVTALICNHNYGRFLAQAIDSALSQTWQPLEVLVIDDGSTDDSRSVIEKYQGRIRAMLKENGGQASAINAGISEARGEIICFLDSDDFWYPEKVERTVAKYKEAPWGLVCHYLQNVDETSKHIINRTKAKFNKTYLQSGDLLDLIIKQGYSWMFSPTSGMSLPKQITQKIFPLPENEWRICADNPLAYAAICHAPVGVINEPLGAYRLHSINRHAGIRHDRIAARLYHFTSRIERYLFLKDYLARLNRPGLNKELKHTYLFYRLYCFIVKERPWNYLFKLWKYNICHHLDLPQNNIQLWFSSARYFFLDTLLSMLFLMHLPNPYNVLRKHFRQEIAYLNPRIKSYIESD
jgi:glycosyltransferase involved in cell wall biosynthesis